jgi:hypothetical protein
MAQLDEGENLFKIEARDLSGNRTEKEVRIRRKSQRVRELGSRLNVSLPPLKAKACLRVEAQLQRRR